MYLYLRDEVLKNSSCIYLCIHDLVVNKSPCIYPYLHDQVVKPFYCVFLYLRAKGSSPCIVFTNYLYLRGQVIKRSPCVYLYLRDQVVRPLSSVHWVVGLNMSGSQVHLLEILWASSPELRNSCPRLCSRQNFCCCVERGCTHMEKFKVQWSPSSKLLQIVVTFPSWSHTLSIQ